jgi:hypothetical protein
MNNSCQGSVPRAYWDAGQSLHELVSFVQREGIYLSLVLSSLILYLIFLLIIHIAGSFDPKSLRIATPEQLGSLLGNIYCNISCHCLFH